MASVNGLDSYFTNLISNLMVLERQPLTRLTEQKDNLTTQKAIYTDLQSKFDGLQTTLDGLRSSQASYSLKTGRKVSVMPPTGSTVVTATVGASALAGNYTLSVTQLAKAHVARSDALFSADQALGMTGTILLGGATDRSAAAGESNLVDTVAGFDKSATIVSGQKELGSGDYFVETRYDSDNSQWQFRLVDAEGTAISIRQGTSETSFGDGWQAFAEGQAYDTGRGMKINFAADDSQFVSRNRLTGASMAAYTAKGAQLAITDDMSLTDVADKINGLSFADGNGLTASVVDHRLVLQAARTGEDRVMKAADVSGRFLRDIGLVSEGNTDFVTQTLGKNSKFTINDVLVERSSNTGLSDVLAGVSLTLAGDAEGKTATMTIATDTSGARTAVNAFVSKFNEMQTYLKNKTAVNKGADGKYTREALAGDLSLKSFSSQMFARFTASAANDGIYTNLRQIGIDLESDLSAKVTDAAKLEDALLNHLPDVQKLMDAVMGSLNTRLTAFSGDKGYAATAKKAAESQIKSVGDRITSMNTTLAKREEMLTNQYAEIQSQLLIMTYQSQQWSSIYSTYSASS